MVATLYNFTFVFRYYFDDNLQKVFTNLKAFKETFIDLKRYILFKIGKFNSFLTQDF